MRRWRINNNYLTDYGLEDRDIGKYVGLGNMLTQDGYCSLSQKLHSQTLMKIAKYTVKK